jgi:hypothetical protein
MKTPTPMLAAATAVVTDVFKSNKNDEEANKSTTNQSNTGDDKLTCHNDMKATTSPRLQNEIAYDLEMVSFVFSMLLNIEISQVFLSSRTTLTII